MGTEEFRKVKRSSEKGSELHRTSDSARPDEIVKYLQLQVIKQSLRGNTSERTNPFMAVPLEVHSGSESSLACKLEICVS